MQTAPRLALRLQAPRLDRIVRGRAWIPVLGALLVAIVGLRVEVLKLGSGVGSQVQQATALQSSNAALRAQISALSDNQRISTLAAAYGMRMPNALDPHFLQASAGHHLRAAIRNISAPAPQTYVTALAAEEQTDQLKAQAGSALSAVGAQTTSGAGLSSGVSNSASASTTSSVNTATQSTSSTGYSSTGGIATSGVSTSVTGGTSGTTGASGTTAATGTTGASGTTGTTGATGTSGTSGTSGTVPPSSTATGSSTPAGSSTGGTGGTPSTSSGTDSTGAISGTSSSTASTNGAAGLAG